MRRRLFGGEESAEADVRPTLLGIVTLMFLLLFFLLATSSGQRLSALNLRLTSPEALAPLPHTGVLQRVVVHVQGSDILVEFSLQSTDISASSTTQEQHQRPLPSRDGRPDGDQFLCLFIHWFFHCILMVSCFNTVLIYRRASGRECPILRCKSVADASCPPPSVASAPSHGTTG